MITDEIVDWVKTLSIWQQILALRVLNQQPLDEEFLKEVYCIFKKESGLLEGDISVNTEFSISLSNKDNCSIRWNSVGHILGVNRLESKEPLEVGEKLTIVYGENGSGKSGYTRLLNNAFISRGDKDILGDIYSSNNIPVYAEFLFDIDGEKRTFKYPENKKEFPFSTIRNFDSKSATDDMMKESTVDFAPSELAFFDTFISGCSEIQKMLDIERGEKEEENPFIKFFQHEGEALNTINSICEKSNVEDIRKKFLINDEEKEKNQKVKIEKAKLISLNVDTQFAQIVKVIQMLNESKEKAKTFC